MALRLSWLSDHTLEFWLNLQRSVDRWEAEASIKDRLQQVDPSRFA